MSAAANPPVDVLIVGAGASGAALAWSLADTRMRIVCLEQGDWPKSTDYPSHGRDWEARQFGDWSIDPNRRRAAADYPVNGTDSPITVVNFNGVGGGTVLYAGHFPRLHPSDFRVRSLDGVADDWPIDYATLEPWFALNDRMMGVSGLAGDPAYPWSSHALARRIGISAEHLRRLAGGTETSDYVLLSGHRGLADCESQAWFAAFAALEAKISLLFNDCYFLSEKFAFP